jgi:hypothetical protein
LKFVEVGLEEFLEDLMGFLTQNHAKNVFILRGPFFEKVTT